MNHTVATSNGEAAASAAVTEEFKPCSACGEDLPRTSFSRKQWICRNVRRCLACIEAGRDSVATTTSASAGKTKKNKKSKPVRANDHQGMDKPTDEELDVVPKLAGQFCSWCGRAEETTEFFLCQHCKNMEYCSRECQKVGWKEHKAVCGQLKQDRKTVRQQRRQRTSQSLSNESSYSEASGVGSYGYTAMGPLAQFMTVGELRGNEQPGAFFASDAAEQTLRRALGAAAIAKLRQNMVQTTRSFQGTFKRLEFFSGDITELQPQDQFLLSCGTLADIDHAKSVLPLVLHLIRISGRKPDGTVPDITDITVRGYGLNALEWAARRGNYAIAEWLATDPRTKIMLTRPDSAPVAWAVYTNKVELAKMLLRHGANSHATTTVVYGNKPPAHLAAENGSFLAYRFLMEECGHDILERDAVGQNVRTSIRQNNKAWTESAGCVAVDNYAKAKGVREYA